MKRMLGKATMSDSQMSQLWCVYVSACKCSAGKERGESRLLELETDASATRPAGRLTKTISAELGAVSDASSSESCQRARQDTRWMTKHAGRRTLLSLYSLNSSESACVEGADAWPFQGVVVLPNRDLYEQTTGISSLASEPSDAGRSRSLRPRLQ